jgi:hypothetical protein
MEARLAHTVVRWDDGDILGVWQDADFTLTFHLYPFTLTQFVKLPSCWF